jgi:LPXTG-motif cell wall-anchored protein
MRAKDLGLWIVGVSVGVTALVGGSAAASDYPPDDTTVTTVYRGGTTTLPSSSTQGELPATGSDSDVTLKMAGGAVVGGAGLLVAARLRRRPSAG